jgi:hypothetical protein
LAGEVVEELAAADAYFAAEIGIGTSTGCNVRLKKKCDFIFAKA